MSWDNKYEQFLKLLSGMLAQSGTGEGFAFDGLVANFDEAWKKMDRAELIRELKQRAQKKPLMAKDWTPLTGRIDYMSITERDVRMRFRNRISSMSNRRINREIYADAPQQHAQAMAKIEAS